MMVKEKNMAGTSYMFPVSNALGAPMNHVYTKAHHVPIDDKYDVDIFIYDGMKEAF